jgi:hypothetical protein
LIKQYPSRSQAKPATVVAAKNAISQYRDRVSAILNSNAAKGKFRQALCLALEANATVEGATRLLSAMASDAQVNMAHGNKYFDGDPGLLSAELTTERDRIASILRAPLAASSISESRVRILAEPSML